ncbi:transferrin [Atheta coriaria]|uniref:transferrin n=1 Tax=Dalotia coriaria TaxID=877792 RepID=UPI0031F40D21
MKLKIYYCMFVFFILVVIGSSYGNKLRVCVVDGRGGFKKAAKHCPTLDRPESKVECVVGIDRMDCLRRISKGKVDFSVFTPEDLVSATNSEVDVLLTNQMKFSKENYEYEVVAIVSDESGINSVHDLKDKNFCHPGYGYETDWTNIITNFLESTTIPQSCDQSLTLTENRIKSSSTFFKTACKAGPWVNDPNLDSQLKKSYPNLCELCDHPARCNTNDKYWGRRGPLFCLTDGVGDISWARLDDVKIHFGITPGSISISPEGYSYLCRDGTKIPVNATSRNPCVWVVKPWPVIGAQKQKASEIKKFLSTLDYNKANEWQQALLTLIQTFKQDIVPLDPIQPIDSYMLEAPGFLSANSFTGCHPPRTIRMCTTSILQNAKCGWMREAAAVYGVEPDLDCIKADNVTHCMEAITVGAADVVLVEPDYVNIAKRKFNLKTLLYETVGDSDKYLTVGIVKTTSGYTKFEDLQGAKACFPSYDGIAWNSAMHALHSRHLLNKCPVEVAFVDFFSSITAPHLPHGLGHHNNMITPPDSESADTEELVGDYGAIRCLNQGLGDVAFLSLNNYEKFFKDPREMSYNINRNNFRVFCHKEPCHLSWAPPGQLMTLKNKTALWIKDATDVFLQLDNLFGKNYKSITLPFTMFDIFDGKSNVLFHDATMRLRTVANAKNSDKMIREYDNVLDATMHCSKSTKILNFKSILALSVVILLLL